MNFALKIILIIIGLLGLILGVVSYNQNRHLQDAKKKSIIIAAISILILLLGIFIRPNTVNKLEGKTIETEDQTYKLSKDEERILRKKYRDLTLEEKRNLSN